MRRLRIWACCATMLLLLAACGSSSSDSNSKDTNQGGDTSVTQDTSPGSDTTVGQDQTQTGQFKLESAEWKEGQEVDAKYKCSGDSVASPPFSWSGAPAGTKSFVLTIQDLDFTDFDHWVVWNIPASQTSLAAGISSSLTGDMTLTDTSLHGIPFLGPYPPPGETHSYRVTIWALSTNDAVEAGVLVKGIFADAEVLGTVNSLSSSANVLGSATLTVKGGGCN